MATTVTNSHRLTSKLRRSCNGCTEAKMGCSKDKPSCSRCTRRGEPCVYAPSKRAGRPGKQELQWRQQEQERQRQDQQDFDMGWIESVAFESTNASPGTTSERPQDSAIELMDLISDGTVDSGPSLDAWLSSPEYSDLFTGLSADSYMDTLDVSTFSFDPSLPTSIETIPQTRYHSAIAVETMHGPSSQGLQGSTPPVKATPTSSSGGMSPISPLRSAELPEASRPCGIKTITLQAGELSSPRRRTTRTSTTNWFASSSAQDIKIPAASDVDPSPFSHSQLDGIQYMEQACMLRALRLLAEIETSTAADASAPFSLILQQNETSIENIHQILTCEPCCADSHLLHLLYLITARTLASYTSCIAAVERSTPSGRSSSARALCPVEFDEEVDEAHVICQIVISRLHEVWKVVRRLGGEKTAGRGDGGLEKGVKEDGKRKIDSCRDRLLLGSWIEGTAMERELKGRLRTLSRSIVEKLES